jgi:hypothetical protein
MKWCKLLDEMAHFVCSGGANNKMKKKRRKENVGQKER